MQGRQGNQLLDSGKNTVINENRLMKGLTPMHNPVTDTRQFLDIGHGTAFAQQLRHDHDGLPVLGNNHSRFECLFTPGSIKKSQPGMALLITNLLYQARGQDSQVREFKELKF